MLCYTLMVAPGFSPSVEKLLCQVRGYVKHEARYYFEEKAPTRAPQLLNLDSSAPRSARLTPATFTCSLDGGLKVPEQGFGFFDLPSDVCEAPCPVPTVQNAAQTGVCKEELPQCSVLAGHCALDSKAQIEHRFPDVVCNPDPCPAPTGVEFAHRKGPCQEGPLITQAAGNGCRGIRMGQKVDSGKEKLTPSTFACEPDPCPSGAQIPFAKNQEGSGCLGVPGRVDGTVIESGETCRTECKEGSQDRCPAEGGVANAGARICEEGNSIESGKLCTTKCNSGYTPNHASLQCRLGKLSPHTFVCNPNPCAVPGVANRLGSGCSDTAWHANLESHIYVTTQCEDGYTPTVAELRCLLPAKRLLRCVSVGAFGDSQKSKLQATKP
ncbi:unnamed protein product [Symbiodinium microadriaticum]|nr:unnamed protein product [Symbiodinium microadriaticum]